MEKKYKAVGGICWFQNWKHVETADSFGSGNKN